MALKWGIVSAGRICHDFVNALKTLPVEEHQVIAIAARDLGRAKEFAQEFDIPKAYGDYLNLAKDSTVEIVYIGTLNPQHFEVAQLMLEHGKHVLCEKPLCINEKQARKLVTFAEEKKLFLMEAIWSRFFPSYQYIRKQIQNGALGDITQVIVEFGTKIDHKDRIVKKSLGGGTVLDLGIYAIQICQWVFQQAPKSIKATGTLNAEGIDLEMRAEISYDGNENKTATIATSSLEKFDNIATIIGTKGQIKVPSFWCPTSIVDVDGTEKTWPLSNPKHGLRFEAEEARKCIRAGKIQSESVSHDESLLIAHIEDEIRKQIGVQYPEDDATY